jgi:hypothetical protein
MDELARPRRRGRIADSDTLAADLPPVIATLRATPTLVAQGMLWSSNIRRSRMRQSHMGRMPYSKAHEEWKIAHSELIGIVKLSTEWMPKAFEWQYQEIGRQSAGPDDSEWIDAYDAATFGVSWQVPPLDP